VSPEAWAPQEICGDESPLSVAFALKPTAAPAALVASAVISPGTVTEGAVVSRTVTVKRPFETLCDASSAVQVTVVEPIGKVSPESWLHATLGLGSTLSIAVTLKVAEAPLELVASFVMSGGKLKVGAAMSTSVTVTLKLADPVLP